MDSVTTIMVREGQLYIVYRATIPVTGTQCLLSVVVVSTVSSSFIVVYQVSVHNIYSSSQ